MIFRVQLFTRGYLLNSAESLEPLKKKNVFSVASEIVFVVFVLIFCGILNKPTTGIPILSTNHHNWMGNRHGVVWKKGHPKIQWFIKTCPAVISLFGHTYFHMFPHIPICSLQCPTYSHHFPMIFLPFPMDFATSHGFSHDEIPRVNTSCSGTSFPWVLPHGTSNHFPNLSGEFVGNHGHLGGQGLGVQDLQ